MNCIISDNYTGRWTGWAGGVGCWENCDPIITNCVIASNEQYGISEGKPTIINCTIADNLQCGMYESDAIV